MHFGSNLVMVFYMKQKTLLLLKQKIQKYLYVNNISVSLFPYRSHILFKLILKCDNISNNHHV